jgi:hypothetical protein
MANKVRLEKIIGITSMTGGALTTGLGIVGVAMGYAVKNKETIKEGIKCISIGLCGISAGYSVYNSLNNKNKSGDEQ